MSEIVLRGLRKSFGSVEVIKEFDLTIADGERLVFVGPSGCGKSTLLRMICGIDDISFGRIYIAGWMSPHFPRQGVVLPWFFRIMPFIRI